MPGGNSTATERWAIRILFALVCVLAGGLVGDYRASSNARSNATAIATNIKAVTTNTAVIAGNTRAIERIDKQLNRIEDKLDRALQMRP